MRRRIAAILAAGLLGVSVGAPAAAQEEETDEGPALLVILDASGSMQAQLGRSTRIAAAKDALRQLIAALPDQSRVGLRLYGHRVPNTDKQRGCRDTQLVVPVKNLDRTALRKAIGGVRPRGFTPIGAALRAGVNDLPAEGSRNIILISDGIDTCAPPRPAAFARRAKQQDVRIDVVGFRVGGDARRQLRDIASAGGGRYVDARSAVQLADRLRRLSFRPFRDFEASGEPVRGGTTAAAATELDEGTFVDSLERGTDRWYFVRLEENQTANVSATLGGFRNGPGTAFGLFSVRFYGTDLISPLDARGIASFDGLSASSTGAISPEIGSDGARLGFERAGHYFVRVSLSDAPWLPGDYPLEMTIAVEGRPEPPPPPPEPSSSWIFLVVLAGGAGAAGGFYVARSVRRVVAA